MNAATDDYRLGEMVAVRLLPAGVADWPFWIQKAVSEGLANFETDSPASVAHTAAVLWRRESGADGADAWIEDLFRIAYGEPPREDDGPAWPPTDGSIGHLLKSAPTPRNWFVRQRLLLGRGHLLTGIGGSSKTTLLYQLAIGAALGRLPWDWRVDHPGTALLLLAEDVADDVHETLDRMVRAMNLNELERARLADKLRIWPLAGTDCRLLAVDGGTIRENDRGRALIERCREFDDVVFIGLDPALGLTEGDENNQAHQRFLGQYADRLAIASGACTVLVSHATKASAMQDELTSHQSRGGGGITDAVRGEFVMRTMTAKEAKQYGVDDLAERKRLVQLVATKGNRIPPEAFVPTWLRRGDGGTLSAADLVEAERGNAAEPTTTDLRIVDVLKVMYRTATPDLKDWRDECKREGLLTGKTDDASKKAMSRAVNRLLEAGLIERARRGGAYIPADDTNEVPV